ncbi:MAG: MarR family winged helix-turn-helix transcriptional regulator [Ilumatobacter sp.]
MTDARWLDATQQQAWRALLVLVNRGLPQLDRTLRSEGLLVVHYSILVALSEAPNDTMRLSELADSANVSQSRLTHRLRTLVERGAVSIVADVDDRRSKHATLTPAGRRSVEEIAPRHVDDVQCLVFDHLDGPETEALANALSKVAAALCDHDHFLGHRT